MKLVALLPQYTSSAGNTRRCSTSRSSTKSLKVDDTKRRNDLANTGTTYQMIVTEDATLISSAEQSRSAVTDFGEEASRSVRPPGGSEWRKVSALHCARRFSESIDQRAMIKILRV